MSAPRIAVSGVLRTWDGAERTGVNGAYVRSVLAAGGVPLLLSPLLGPSYAVRALDGVDGVVLTGGEDIHPALYGAEPSPHLYPPSRERDLFELALFATARQRELPVLGICRGIQLVNVGLGGTLFQDLPSERPGPVAHDPGGARDARSHAIELMPGSRAAAALGGTALTRELVSSPGGGSARRWPARLGLEFGRVDRGGGVAGRCAVAARGAVAPRGDARGGSAPERGLFRALIVAAEARAAEGRAAGTLSESS